MNVAKARFLLWRIIAKGFLFCPVFAFADPVGSSELKNALDDFACQVVDNEAVPLGYPANQNIDLKEFYDWYLHSVVFDKIFLNNAANPRNKDNPYKPNTHKYENEVIEFFAPLYGFEKDEVWGIVTSSGTDGNNHGIYFGVKDLFAKTNMRPVVYVSQDAHFSIMKIADLQNLDVKVIPADYMGCMKISELEKELDPEKPALIVITLGTTFKGAIDSQEAIEAVLQRKKPIAVYRHIDGALVGGYSIFLDNIEPLVDKRRFHFDSIAISGHKFFGFDEPMGIFITGNDVLSHQNSCHIPYLNDHVPTITCSRSGIAPLKFWWKIKKNGIELFREQAKANLENAQYLKNKLDEIHYPSWKNTLSNIVFFKQPCSKIMKKWNLAPSYDLALGGKLAHVVVMQHVTREKIDLFLKDIALSIQQKESQ